MSVNFVKTQSLKRIGALLAASVAVVAVAISDGSLLFLTYCN
jgi:hypothetical protein